MGGDPDAIGGLREVQRRTFLNIQPGRHLLGQNRPNGVSDLTRLGFDDHKTNVITDVQKANRESGQGRMPPRRSRMSEVGGRKDEIRG